jgi:hypothetical protein
MTAALATILVLLALVAVWVLRRLLAAFLDGLGGRLGERAGDDLYDRLRDRRKQRGAGG